MSGNLMLSSCNHAWATSWMHSLELIEYNWVSVE